MFENFNETIKELSDKLLNLQTDLKIELNKNIEKLAPEKRVIAKDFVERANKGEQLDIKTIIDNLK